MILSSWVLPCSILLHHFVFVSAATTKCSGIVGVVASSLSAYAPAQSFCSSRFPVPRVTTTVGAPTTTIITTVTTVTSPTTVSTVTSTVTPVTLTDTVVVATTTITSTVSTTTSTETDTETDTVTTSTTTTIDQSQKKRAATKDPRASKLTSLASQASAYVRSVCTCLENPVTTTVTTTPSTTISVSATLYTPVTATTTISTTATSTLSVTSTETASVTATTTATITTTTTTTVTTTATSTLIPCNDPNGNIAGAGGCSSTCYCDSSTDGKDYCTSSAVCGQSCTSNDDCGLGNFCSNRPYAVSVCGYQICETTSGCTSSSSKRSLFGLGEASREGRFKPVTRAREMRHEKRVL